MCHSKGREAKESRRHVGPCLTRTGVPDNPSARIQGRGAVDVSSSLGVAHLVQGSLCQSRSTTACLEIQKERQSEGS